MASLISPLQRTLTRMRNSSSSILRSVFLGLLVPLFGIIYLMLPVPVSALYPSDPVSVEGLKADLHGQNLQKQEYVKYDVSGVDFSGANLEGSFFSVSDARNANFSGANLDNVIAYATHFENADLSNASLRNADLLKSFFDGAEIDGADFSDANLDQSQQRALCARATGSTFDSLACGSVSDSYVPSV